MNGFTLLNAIANRFSWNTELISSASKQCNSRYEIAIISELKPTLLLVPSTQGKGDTDFLVKDLINSANAVSADVLNFTHFGFIQNRLPRKEITAILDYFMNPSVKRSIRVIVWEIDFRFKKEMIDIWKIKKFDLEKF